MDLHRFDFSSSTKGNLPQVLLLSEKKDTPVIWRVLSGFYCKRFFFFDAEVYLTVLFFVFCQKYKLVNPIIFLVLQFVQAAYGSVALSIVELWLTMDGL